MKSKLFLFPLLAAFLALAGLRCLAADAIPVAQLNKTNVIRTGDYILITVDKGGGVFGTRIISLPDFKAALTNLQVLTITNQVGWFTNIIVVTQFKHLNLNPSQFIATDADKVIVSTLDGNTLTNLNGTNVVGWVGTAEYVGTDILTNQVHIGNTIGIPTNIWPFLSNYVGIVASTYSRFNANRTLEGTLDGQYWTNLQATSIVGPLPDLLLPEMLLYLATNNAANLTNLNGTNVLGSVANALAAVWSTNWSGLAQSNAYNGSFTGDGAALTNLPISGLTGIKGYIVLASPFRCDGTGCKIYTNDYTKTYYGQGQFADDAAKTANWCEYTITVPEDLDTTVDLKVERLKFQLGAADTGKHYYEISVSSVADSAAYAGSLGDAIACKFAGDASGAEGDVETVSNITLTGWKSALTAGRLLVIRLARVGNDGTDDTSTADSYSGPLVISYGVKQ